jgi:type I restriction enzyme S subunit
MQSKFVDPSREGITELAVDDGKAKVAREGTLLMSFKLTIGRVGFAARDIYPNEAIVMIEADETEILKEFLYLSLGSMDLSAGSGRAVKGATLNSVSLAAIRLSIPPIYQQEQIVALISSMDEARSRLEATLSEAKTLRSALLPDLLSGNHVIPETYDELIGAA